MLTTELCARLCADFPLQLPDAPACFACTRVVLDPWDDAEGGTVFIGEGTVDRPDRFYLLCAPGAPQHPNAAHYADPALTLPLVRAVHRLLEPEGGKSVLRSTIQGYWAESGVSRFRSCALRRRRRRSARSSPLRAAALRSSRAIRPDRDPRSRNILRSRSRKPLRAG